MLGRQSLWVARIISAVLGLALVLSALVTAQPAHADGAPANLITNGSFESPVIAVPCPNSGLGNVTPGICSYLGGSTGIDGWMVGGNSVDLVNNWDAADASQSIDLSGGGPGSLTQTVATQPGEAYTLTWYIAGNWDCGQPVKTMAVSWNGTVIDSPEFDTTGRTATNMGWTQLAIDVTATGTSSTVEFADTTPDQSLCGAALDDVTLVPVPISTPSFFQQSPALKTLVGQPYSAAFSATGIPSYSLTGAPAWLSVDQFGAVTGTPPAGTTSFTYSVQASNADGSAVAGPFTVEVDPVAAVSGTVTDGGESQTPVAGSEVQVCVTDAGNPAAPSECQETQTAHDGTFSAQAPVGSTVLVTAFPLPGSNDVTTSADPVTVPADGLTGVAISLGTIEPLPGGVTVNGTPSPTMNWDSPSVVSATGCANGFGQASVIGQNTQTGAFDTQTLPLTESPAGSGTYTGTIPPLYPVHGPAEVDTTVTCPPQGSVIPDAGPAGTPVAIFGSGFAGATGVTFGGVQATSISVAGDEIISAVAPPGTGTVPVAVQASGKSTVVGHYEYMAVTSLTPATGPKAGGTQVMIKGTGLGSAQAVYFGTTAAPFTQVSDTEIETTSPPGTGTVDVTVQAISGETSAVSAADQFSYAGAAAGARPAALVRAAPRTTATERPTPAPRPPLTPALSLFPSCSDAASIPQQIIECLSTQARGAGLDLIDTGINSVVATAHPTCQANRDVVISAAETAAQPAINAASSAALAVLRPLMLRLLAASFLAGPEAILGVAALNFAITVFVRYWVQSTIDNYISSKIKAKYASLGCPDNSPGGNAYNPNVKIDPSGTVLDAGGHPVKGATVTILRSDTAAGPFLAEAPASPDIDPNTNPETTGADGGFHWDVVAGWYEVSASAKGCTAPADPLQSAVTIGPYPVPPPQLGLTITLTCAGEPAVPAPAVSSLSAMSGPTAGGTRLTVLGSNFTPASSVTFGTTQAKSVTYLSAQALQVTAPAGSGVEDVRVRTQGGTSKVVTADKFFFGAAPVVRKVSPAAGPATGGSAVTITGTGLTGATAVSFGGVPAVSFSVRSATSIKAIAPANVPAKVDVQVADPAGVSAAVKADEFSFGAVTAYVATASGLVPVNAATGQVKRRVAITGATAVAITPNGSTAYVVSRATGKVTPVKVATGKAGKVIKVGRQPAAIVITPSGAAAYVVDEGAGAVTPIALSRGKARKAIKVGKQPVAIAIAPNGTTAYVVNEGSGTLTPIKLSSGKAATAIKVGKQPDAIAIAPDGKTAYVASATGTVRPVTLATRKVGKPIKAGSGPVALAISADGSTLYVADFGTAKAHGSTLTPIALATRKPGEAIKVGLGPDAVVLTPGGLFALVASFYSGTITPVRLSAAAAGRAIKVGSKPASLALMPST